MKGFICIRFACMFMYISGFSPEKFHSVAVKPPASVHFGPPPQKNPPNIVLRYTWTYQYTINTFLLRFFISL